MRLAWTLCSLIFLFIGFLRTTDSFKSVIPTLRARSMKFGISSSISSSSSSISPDDDHENHHHHLQPHLLKSRNGNKSITKTKSVPTAAKSKIHSERLIEQDEDSDTPLPLEQLSPRSVFKL